MPISKDPKKLLEAFTFFTPEERAFLADIAEKYPPLMPGLLYAAQAPKENRYNRALMARSVTPRKIWLDLGIRRDDAQTCIQHTQSCVALAYEITDEKLRKEVNDILWLHDVTASMGLEPAPGDKLTEEERYKMERLAIRYLMEGDTAEEVEAMLSFHEEFMLGQNEAARLARDLKKLETLQHMQMLGVQRPDIRDIVEPFWELTRDTLETEWAQEKYQQIKEDPLYANDTVLLNPAEEDAYEVPDGPMTSLGTTAWGEFSYAFKEAFLTTGTSLMGEPRQSGRAKAEQSFSQDGHFHATMHGYYLGKFVKYALAPYSFIAGIILGDKYAVQGEERHAKAEQFKQTADVQTRQAINETDQAASYTRPLEIVFRVGGFIAGQYMKAALLGAPVNADDTAKTTMPELQQEKTAIVASYVAPEKPDPKTTFTLKL